MPTALLELRERLLTIPGYDEIFEEATENGCYTLADIDDYIEKQEVLKHVSKGYGIFDYWESEKLLDESFTRFVLDNNLDELPFTAVTLPLPFKPTDIIYTDNDYILLVTCSSTRFAVRLEYDSSAEPTIDRFVIYPLTAAQLLMSNVVWNDEFYPEREAVLYLYRALKTEADADKLYSLLKAQGFAETDIVFEAFGIEEEDD